MTTLEAVAGQTAPIYLLLKLDGAVPVNSDESALTMSGMSCLLVVHDYDGNVVTILGAVTVNDSAAWRVKYSPNAADLTVGEFRWRIKVTDGSGKIAYFPSSEWGRLVVRAA